MTRPQAANLQVEATCVLLLIGCLAHVLLGLRWQRLAAAGAGAVVVLRYWDVTCTGLALLLEQAGKTLIWSTSHSQQLVPGYYLTTLAFVYLFSDKVRNMTLQTCGVFITFCLALTVAQLLRLCMSCIKDTCTGHKVLDSSVVLSLAGLSLVEFIDEYLPSFHTAHESVLANISVACFAYSCVMSLLPWLYPFLLADIVNAAVDVQHVLLDLCMFLAKYDQVTMVAATAMMWLLFSLREELSRSDAIAYLRLQFCLLFGCGTRCVLMASTGWASLLSVHAIWRLCAISSAVFFFGHEILELDAGAPGFLMTWITAQVLLCAIWVSEIWQQQCSAVGQMQ